MNRRTSRRKIEHNHTDIKKVRTLGYYRQRLINVKVQVGNLQNPSKLPMCVNNYLLYRLFYSCALVFPHHSKRKLFGLKTDALVVWQLSCVVFIFLIILFRYTGSYAERGEFHISHDASLHTILSSFRTHVILSVQQGRGSWTTMESDSCGR